MRLFGWEITVRRVPKPLDTRQRLFHAVDEANAAWAEAKREKLWLNLWIDWPAKELVVTQVDQVRVYDGNKKAG